MRRLAALFLLGCALGAAPAQAAPKPRQVQVAAARLSLADVLPQRRDLSVVDLGVAPAAGGTRLMTREQMQKALKHAQEAGHEIQLGKDKLPRSVRFVRKMETLSVVQLERVVRAAVKVPTGVRLTSLSLSRALKVPAGWTRAHAELPRHPRRAGDWRTSIRLSFLVGGSSVAVLSVPAKFKISAQAARPDVSRGAALVVVVVRGRVEIRTRGVADGSADVGDMLPVRVGNKVFQARLVSPGQAEVSSR